jgi:radical SAM protein with 4Fe4S-binding SPASM domain
MADLARLRRQVGTGVKILSTRPKAWQRVVINQGAAMLRSTYVPTMPTFLGLEPTNACNYRCPVCETGAGILGRRTGHMKLESFKQLIDQTHHHVRSMIFYFMGEPFLNPAAYDMIRYAKDHNIEISTCTNGELVDPVRVIDSGIDDISFQIGGATNETHRIYRVRGQLDRVLERCAATVEEKRRRNAATQVNLGFIVMRHNEHEVGEFFAIARRLGVDEARVICPAVRNMDQGHEFLTKEDRYWVYDRQLFEEQGILRPKQVNHNQCWWIWHSTNIQVNGDVVPCCRDPLGKYVMGNVFETPLSEIWNGPKYRAFRERILTDQANVDMCQGCSGYDDPGRYDFGLEDLADIVHEQGHGELLEKA